LKPEDGSIDHVVPRSRGGATSWDNCVWASKRINALKGNRLPEEVGLKLWTVPRAPKEMPVSALIGNAHGVGDWRRFLR
jgi:5-methylcytosine-specific restriction endonuclease McrA